MKDLKVEVVEVISRCGARHKPGDCFYIRGEGMLEVPEGKRICLYALNSLFPFLTAKQRQDELPQDDWIAETEILTCPDPRGVRFRITALD
ncbi:MAG: TIGR04076 family protein [Candidatus Aminicenantes bacterium]|nr:TIGR04076 family protein [Candidatus Aminicenantes bacterium]